MKRFQGEAGRESASSSSYELPWARRTGAEESRPSPLRCTPGWILGTKPRCPGWTLASATNVVGVVGEACGWRGRSVVAAGGRQHLNPQCLGWKLTHLLPLDVFLSSSAASATEFICCIFPS